MASKCTFQREIDACSENVPASGPVDPERKERVDSIVMRWETAERSSTIAGNLIMMQTMQCSQPYPDQSNLNLGRHLQSRAYSSHLQVSAIQPQTHAPNRDWD
jgi:hypothetical protein